MSCTKQTYSDSITCPICRAKADVSGACIPDDHYDAYEPTSCRIECSKCGLDTDDWSNAAGGFAFDVASDEYDAEQVARAVAHYTEQLRDQKQWAVIARIVLAHDLEYAIMPLSGESPSCLLGLEVDEFVTLRMAVADHLVANNNQRIAAVREVA